MMQKIEQFIFILVLVAIAFPLVSNAGSEPFLKLNHDADSAKRLQAIKIDGSSISPKDGLDSSEARKLIADSLLGIKKQRRKTFKVFENFQEITTNELWANMGAQLYKVNAPSSWVNLIVMIKNRKIICILSGMPIESIYLSDLDNDGIYELYSDFLLGSGEISEQISGFNMATNEQYYLSMRGTNNLHLTTQNGILMAEVSPYDPHHPFARANAVVHKLILKESNHKKELGYE